MQCELHHQSTRAHQRMQNASLHVHIYILVVQNASHVPYMYVCIYMHNAYAYVFSFPLLITCARLCGSLI